MAYQKIFRQNYIGELIRGVRNGNLITLYDNETFEFNEDKVLLSPLIAKPDNGDLHLPEGRSYYDFENAKIIFESYRSLTPLQASDVRFWTYLAHADYYKYMKRRWPGNDNAGISSRSKYILDHWFILTPTQNNFMRHAIAGLWWGAYLTYDVGREDPYELTRVLFTQLDFATRTLGAYSLARHKEAVLGIVDFILQNPDLFVPYFEDKTRFITRYLNQVGGIKPLAYFDRSFFRDTLSSVANKIALVKPKSPLNV
jgi:Family of unknown function (DUF6339)